MDMGRRLHIELVALVFREVSAALKMLSFHPDQVLQIAPARSLDNIIHLHKQVNLVGMCSVPRNCDSGRYRRFHC